MSSIKHWLLSALVVTLVSGTSLAASTELESVPATRVDLPRVYRLDGVVEAVNRGTLSAQTSGRVVAVNFDVDDYVRQGDVLVLIEDSEHQTQVDQAEANLQAAAARRSDAEKEFRRIEGVFAKQAVSKADMDKVTAALDQARAGELAAKAALEQALQKVEYTRVKAPYNGIVTERLIEVGETAQPGQPLMSGLSLDSMRISVDVPQNLVTSIRKERKAKAEIGGQWVDAEEVTVFPVADPRSDTFKVRLSLPDGVDEVFPGMYVKVGFVAGVQPGLVIPLSAVVLRSEVVAVYVIDGEGQVHFRHVRLGSAVGPERVSVLSGVDEGELLATDPLAAGILYKSQRKGRVVDNE